jgi:hypothetical protein
MASPDIVPNLKNVDGSKSLFGENMSALMRSKAVVNLGADLDGMTATQVSALGEGCKALLNWQNDQIGTMNITKLKLVLAKYATPCPSFAIGGSSRAGSWIKKDYVAAVDKLVVVGDLLDHPCAPFFRVGCFLLDFQK